MLLIYQAPSRASVSPEISERFDKLFWQTFKENPTHFSLRTHNKKHKSTFLGTINRIDNSIIAFRWHNWYRYTNFHVGSLHLCNNQWIIILELYPSLQIPCSQHFRPGRAEDNFVFWRSFCLRKVMKSGWNLAQNCPKFRRLRQATYFFLSHFFSQISQMSSEAQKLVKIFFRDFATFFD